MNPNAGSFVVNPRLQRLFATIAIGFPSGESIFHIFSSILTGHFTSKSFAEEIVKMGDGQDVVKMSETIVKAALSLHKRIAGTFRKSVSRVAHV